MSKSKASSISNAKYKAKNKEKIKIKAREWYERNKEKVINQSKAWKENNKEQAQNTKKEWLEKIRPRLIEEDPLRFLHIAAKDRARRRKEDFQVSSAFLRELWKKQEGKCYYTGLSMEYTYAKKSPYQVSIDKKNPLGEYTEDNTVLCCLSINYAKNNFSENQILEFLAALK